MPSAAVMIGALRVKNLKILCYCKGPVLEVKKLHPQVRFSEEGKPVIFRLPVHSACLLSSEL